MKFVELADAFSQLGATTSRRAMVRILSGLIRRLDIKELSPAIYLIQARLGPPFSTLDFGLDEKLAMRALADASGQPVEAVETRFKRVGDLGTVANEILPERSQGLSIVDTFHWLERIAEVSGPGAQVSKIELLSDLLTKMNGQEGQYIIRIVLGRLRLGVGDATIMDALSWAVAGNSSLRPAVERAYDMTSDLGLAAEVLFQGGAEALERIEPKPGRPVRPALAERLPSAQDIVRHLGRVLVEPKYDGIRLQVHRLDDEVRIFSRRIEDVTHMFPEIIAAAKEQVRAAQVIFEGEATAYNPDTGEYLPFQVTAQRRRKRGTAEMAARYPLRLFAFDLLSADGEDYTTRPLKERRQRLQQVLRTEPDSTITISPGIITSDPKEVEHFFLDSVTAGLEGIMAKRLESLYRAGVRSYDWVKLKRGYQAKLRDTVDTVLVGYLLGKGRRAKLGIGSLLAAVYDSDKDEFKTVAKIGSGLSDENWVRLRQLLDQDRVSRRPARVNSLIEPDVWVQPHYVVEVYADEITRSPVHTAGKRGGEPGYALRFPRLVDWIRTDKSPEDATTEDEIVKLYKMQTKPSR